jgi:signal transduction histidine kinase
VNHTPSILVIENEEDIRAEYSSILTEKGYTVETTETGETALDLVTRKPFDLLVVDLMIPTMGGLKLMGRVRAHDPEIIMIAAAKSATIQNTVKAMKQGAYDYLPKPIASDRLVSAVSCGLEERRLRLEAQALMGERDRKLLEDGQELGAVATLRNVTGLKQEERAKSHFMSVVTHELRAPLSAIEGYLTAYLTAAAGGDPAKNRRMLERAQQRTHALLELVDDLLQFSKLESRRVGEKKELLDLSKLLTGTVDLIRNQGAAQSLRFEVEVPATLPLVEADRGQMERLFTNLISNAIKYNVKHGTVKITTKADRHFLKIKVKDTGVGIPKEYLPRIFEEFYRVSTPETRYVTGTGLGLSIVKRIVEAHHGLIKVESKMGHGSTFTVRLPLKGSV